ncbi:MAG: hypothetical protein LJE62_00010 [Silicimonas sp.]|jgi:hypothetical protein|nr:hypothetical protein [Silicimonas sp.]
MTTSEPALVKELDRMIRRLRPEQMRCLLADIMAAYPLPDATHPTTERLQ